MTFQAINYAGQYPPLHPRSSADITSFTNLHASLRTIPELSKEGDKILNEEMLAKLVDGVMRFQRDHLGRKSKSKYWPTVRLPSPIFADRSSYPAGPLGIAILSAFRIKQVSQWRNFNFDNPKLFDDNITIIKKMESDLITRGYLRRPVIYFDASVERVVGATAAGGASSCTKAGEIQRLTKIAVRFGARVVTDIKDMGDVTHIVAYDPEEHDTVEVMEEETKSGGSGSGSGGINNNSNSGGGGGLLRNDGEDGIGGEEEDLWSSEKKYLKTLAIVDTPMENDDGNDGNGASTPSGKQNATKKMALVHWWYHPSSYDEWMPAEEVMDEEGIINFKDGEDEPHPGIPGGACVVACKFVRDVEKFNEWGVESDYAIADYEKKVDYLLLRKKNENVIPASTSSKKSSKNKRVASTKTEPPISESSEDVEDGHAAKKRKLDGDVIISSAASPSKKSKTKSINPSNPSTSSTITTGNLSSSMYSQSRQSSERRLGTGMNPRRILTGIRGSRNEVIRRTVYDGALRVEDEPYKIIKEAMTDYLLGNDGRSINSKMPTMPPPTLSARPEWRKLLPLTGFIRPSVHTSLKCMIVTELTLAEDPPSEELDTDVSTVVPTIATNMTVPIMISPEVDEAAIERGVVEGDMPLPIRGGGSEEDKEAVGFSSQQLNEEAEVHNSNDSQRNDVATQPAIETNAPPSAESSHVEMMDVSAIDEHETGPSSEDMQVESTDAVIEETSSDQNVQEKAHELLESQSTSESLPKTNDEVGAAATSVDVGIGPASSGVDAPKTPSSEFISAAVDAAADEANVITEKEEVTEAMKVASVEEVSVTTALPVQDETTHEHPPEVTPAASAANDTQSSTSLASAGTGTSSAAVVTDFVSSNSAATSTSTASAMDSPAVCQVISLPPNTQISNSLYRSTSTPNEEDINRTVVRPPWYQTTKASEFEKRTLPEWFNFTAPHRTESTYIATRETILKLAKCNSQQYITTTAIRRSVAGDAGSLLRLHKFLMNWGLLNGGQIGETAPSDAVLRGVHTEGGSLAKSKRKHSQMEQQSTSWTDDRMHALEISVVKHTSKKPDEGSNELRIIVDWNAVASDLGSGVTASDCQLAFINPPTEDDKMAAVAISSNNKWSLSQFLDGVRPEVLKAAVEASLQVTDDITEVRKASIVAVLASAAAEKGAQIESEIENTLMDIVDQRLQRLENRVAILDDVEALLEAERVSLELERRDMYTTRCRHWFGDGST